MWDFCCVLHTRSSLCLVVRYSSGTLPLTAATSPLQDSITALAWHPTRATADVTHVLAVGFDNGHIELYRMTSSAGTSSSSMTWQLLHALDVKLCHTATVRRLEWRPEQRRTASAKIPATAESAKLPMLASCSMDGSVRLFNVDILALVG